MFNLQGSEIVIVLLLALVVLGPEKLPDAMRKAGQFYAELKKMSTGFQSEFKAAIDEPMREMRDTANVLRDSADFTKLKNGERDEKPKSAEMPPISDADPEPTEPGDGIDSVAATDEPALAADSKPAPFSAQSSAAPRRVPPTASGDSTDDSTDTVDPGAPPSGAAEPAADSKPEPFSGRSSTAPRPTPAASPSDDSVDSVEAQDGESAAFEDADEPTAADQPADADDASGHAR